MIFNQYKEILGQICNYIVCRWCTRHAINTKLRIGEIIHIALYQGLKEGACYDFEKS